MDTATIASSQSKTFEVSSRNNRIKGEAKAKAEQHMKEQHKNQPHDTTRPMVRDDEDNDVRPHPITDGKKKTSKIGVRKPGAPGGIDKTSTTSQSGAHLSQMSGDSDKNRRPSVQTAHETSTGGTSQNERSISRADRSSDGSEGKSGISDDIGNPFGDDSSDSHSTWGDRSSDQSSSFYRGGTSQMSSDAGFRHGSQMPIEGTPSAAGAGAAGGGGQRRAEFPLMQKPWIVLPREPKEYTHEEHRAWRQEEVLITLTETPVLQLFSRNDELVAHDSEEALLVKKSNQRYKEYCASRRDGESGGRYATSGVTTLNNPQMCELDEAATPRKVPSGPIQVYPWKLYDALERTAAELTAAAAAEEQGMGAADAPDDAAAGGGEGDEGGGMASDDDAENEGEGDAGGGGEGTQAAAERKKNAWKRSATLAESLLVVERCVVQTIFDELQVLYRGLSYDRLTDAEPTNAAAGAGGASGSAGAGDGGAGGVDPSATMNLDSPASKTVTGELDITKRGMGTTMKHRGGGGGGGADGEGLLGSTTAGGGATFSGTAASALLSGTMMSNSGAAAGASREKVKVLFRYSDREYTEGRTVSCMSNNRINNDLLAAGYNGKGQSVIACWSLKNPTAPERVIVPNQGDASITTMHFGKQHGSLLAVGTTDGVISLYDVRKHGNSPALMSAVGQGQHTGTIWEVRWVDKGKERNEALVSISADGWVKEWAIKKGLEHVSNLIRLKRVVSRDSNMVAAGAAYGSGGGGGSGGGASKGAAKATTREALLARQSGGMCFDMNPEDPMLYVVGTEDGTISKCTKSKDDNSILDYSPHAEPVYRVRWSPFNSNYFLTCSADWTSRLYHIDQVDPVAIFDSNRQDPVQDFAWSPHCSTLFGCITAGGRVELWDVAEPLQARTVFQMAGDNRQLTSMLFAEQASPVLTVGDSKGDVSVLKLNGVEFERNSMPDMEQSMKLQALHEPVKKQYA